MIEPSRILIEPKPKKLESSRATKIFTNFPNVKLQIRYTNVVNVCDGKYT